MSNTQDPAQTAMNDALTALRNAEREVSNARYFDVDKHMKTRLDADTAVRALEAIKADHPSLPDMRKRIDGIDAKGDEILVGNARDTMASQLRGAARDLRYFDEARAKGPAYCDPATAADKLRAPLLRVTE